MVRGVLQNIAWIQSGWRLRWNGNDDQTSGQKFAKMRPSGFFPRRPSSVCHSSYRNKTATANEPLKDQTSGSQQLRVNKERGHEMRRRLRSSWNRPHVHCNVFFSEPTSHWSVHLVTHNASVPALDCWSSALWAGQEKTCCGQCSCSHSRIIYRVTLADQRGGRRSPSVIDRHPQRPSGRTVGRSRISSQFERKVMKATSCMYRSDTV